MLGLLTQGSAIDKVWRKAKELNPRDALLGLAFKTSCAPPRAAFRINWLGRPDLNREGRVWNPMVCQLAYAPRISGACGRTRTYEVRTDARFTVECFCCSATHASSDLKFQIQDSK